MRFQDGAGEDALHRARADGADLATADEAIGEQRGAPLGDPREPGPLGAGAGGSNHRAPLLGRDPPRPARTRGIVQRGDAASGHATGPLAHGVGTTR